MTDESPITAEPLWAHPDDDEVRYVDFTRILTEGVPRTITSVALPVEVTTSDLTLGDQAVCTGQLTLGDGNVVRPRHAVQFRCSGGDDDVDYEIAVTVTLDDGSIKTRNVLLKVRGS